jgi:RecJ-like exonuclease
MSKEKLKIFRATNHLCRHCGIGTIVEVLHTGPTGGGNAIYECLTCGKTCCSTSTHPLCYCGKNVKYYEYRCAKRDDDFEDVWTIMKAQYKLMILMKRNNVPFNIEEYLAGKYT